MLGPKYGYTDILDKFIKEKVKKDSERPRSFPLRPSAAGHCSRKLAYDLMEYRGKQTYSKDLFSPAVYRLLNLGHSVEYSALQNFKLVEDLQVKYKQQAVTLFRLEDVNKKEQELIEGSVDAVFVLDSPEEKYKAVVDIKSAKDSFHKAFTTKWESTLDKFKSMSTVETISDTAFYIDSLPAFLEENRDPFLADNLYQLNLYACSNFMKIRGIDHAVIYKYGKNDSRHYELRFRPSDAIAEQIEKKFNDINQKVAKDQPEKVVKDYNLGSARCAFCPYQKQCWPEVDANKAFFNKLKGKEPVEVRQLGDLGNEIERCLSTLTDMEPSVDKRDSFKEQVVNFLLENKVYYFKLDNGRVYELKFLKSPKPHYELRASK